MMKRINELQVCLLLSLIAHTGLVGSGMLHFDPIIKEKPFEVAFEVEEEILPEIYEVQEEKKMEPPVIDQTDLIEPVPDESIVEVPKPVDEDEEIKKSLLRYQDSIKQKIQQEKQYPRWALRAGHEGGARISFSVLSSGQIKDLRLLDSSGFDELDREALDSVERAAPFRSFPDSIPDEEMLIELEIYFRITKESE